MIVVKNDIAARGSKANLTRNSIWLVVRILFGLVKNPSSWTRQRTARFERRNKGSVAIAVFVTISLAFFSFARLSRRVGSLSFSAGFSGTTLMPTTEESADKMFMIVPFAAVSPLLSALSPPHVGVEHFLKQAKQLVVQFLHLWLPLHPGVQDLHF